VLLQDLRKGGKLIFGESLQVVLHRLDVDRRQDAHVVQDGRKCSGQRDGEIADSEELGHDEGAAPIMGGMICPPHEAQASVAPAKYGLYPIDFISGMVKVPVPTTFATELPLIVPNRQLATTATLAGPPRLSPRTAKARSMNTLPTPVVVRTIPKTMNK